MSIQNINIKNTNLVDSRVVRNDFKPETKFVPAKSSALKMGSIPIESYKAYSNISFKASMEQHLGQGARYIGDGVTKFTLTAPNLREVELNAFSQDPTDEDAILSRVIKMEKNGGRFEKVVDGINPGDKYFYTITKKDGTKMDVYDPRADYLPFDILDCDEYSNLAEVVDHDSYEWTDTNWMHRRALRSRLTEGWGLPSDTVLESMHIGALGGFKEAKKELARIADSKVANTVRIMPIGEFYGKKNWGYDEVAKYAVENSYGSPDDFKDFVNFAHEKGISVILDVVPNHFGPFGSVIQEFIPAFDNHVQTPWGNAPNYNGKNNEYMRSYMTDMLMNWAVNYHVDGFRMDATHHMKSDDALLEIMSELRSHSETKDLILYPEDMRISRTRANANMPKEVSDKNWGFDAITTFDFYKSLLANVTKEDHHGIGPSLFQLERIYGKTILNSHEDMVKDDMLADPSYRQKCRDNLQLPEQSANNYLINISNQDEIGNDAGGRRNLVDVLSSNLGMTLRCDMNWQKAQSLIFEMIKHYAKTGKCLPEEQQKSLGILNPVDNDTFVKEIRKAFEANKLIFGAMMMHPSPKEFFMGDERGELSPFKFFSEYPNSAVNPDTNRKVVDEIADEKGYRPDLKAFEESKMDQDSYRVDWISQGMTSFAKDFAKLVKNNTVFKSGDFSKLCSYSHNAEDVLEVKRYNDYNDQVIAVMNFSSEPKYNFELKTTDAFKVKEIINSNSSVYSGNGQFINKTGVEGRKITLPPNSIVVFEPVK